MELEYYNKIYGFLEKHSLDSVMKNIIATTFVQTYTDKKNKTKRLTFFFNTFILDASYEEIKLIQDQIDKKKTIKNKINDFLIK